MGKAENIRDKGMEEPTERDTFVLDHMSDSPSGDTVREILRNMKAEDTFQIREALIGLLTRMEGMGLVRRFSARGDRPATWVKTFRGKEA